VSKGVVTTNNVSASDNDGHGVYIDNQDVTTGQAVNVNNVATFEPEFSLNGGSGLKVLSRGSIKVMDFHANENGQTATPGSGYGVELSNDYAGSTGTITVGTTRAGWRNEMRDNRLSGLLVRSRGMVTLVNMDASGNGISSSDGYGAYVDNRNAATPKA
jgi:hypothetical protein